MAGNTLTKYISIDPSSGGSIDFTVKIKQPTAGAKTNPTVYVKAEGLATKKTHIITTQFGIYPDTTRYNGPSLTLVGGSSSVESSWTALTGLAHSTGTDRFYIKITLGSSEGSGDGYVSGVIYWTSSVGTPGAPGGVRVGTSSSYSSNTASNYNVSAPNPGSFYITWTAGSAGTNNSISGYRRRVIYSSNNGVVSSTTVDISGTGTLYSKSTGWSTSGNVYKAEVCTLGAAGVNSGYTRSTNTITLTSSSISYTACTAPTQVRVGSSTTHANNSTTYSTTTPSPGAFYITWNAGGAGTNNPITGYRRKVQNTSISSSYWTADTNASTRYSYSSGWNASAAGYTYRCTVMTLGSVSGYDSAYSSAYGDVTFTASSSGYTLTADGNGGTWGSSTTKDYTNAAWTHQEIEPPAQTNYEVAGWYYNSTQTSYIDYGTARSLNANYVITFWTDATTYAQGGSSSNPCSIFSCAQSGGYCLTNENGNWELQVHDGSGWKVAGVAASSISSGYHEWCCLINAKQKYIRLYLDGVMKKETALTNAQISFGTDKKLLLGAELASGGGMYSNSGFVGKIGNFKLVYYTSTELSYADQSYNNFDIPAVSGKTIYAYWKRNGYTVTVNPNGGSWNGTTSNSTINVIYGTNRNLAVPTRAGYDFVGWASLNASFTNDYTAGTGFFSSAPTKYIWGASGTNNSSVSVGSMDTASGFPSSAKMLTITEPGTSTRATGWSKLCQPAKNTAILVTIVAKIPRGSYLGMHNGVNYQGTGYTWEYLTPMAGTGQWKTYAIRYDTGVISDDSAVVGSTGYFVIPGNSQGIGFSSTPNNATSYIAHQAIGLFDSKFNAIETYRPNTSATSDTITAIWIEKKYNISYVLNDGYFNNGTNNIYTQSGSGATAEIGALNPENAYWNRSPYYVGDEAIGNNNKARPNRTDYFEIENPLKDDSISTVNTTITTSFNAASSVASITSTKSVITITPQNFYKWTITGMDSATHYYWGKASGATVNSGIAFTSTSITLTSSNLVPNANLSWADGRTQTVPYGFYNLSQSAGDVVFTAGWTPGTASTRNAYTDITLPTIPAKSNTSVTTTRTVNYNANGGTGTTTAQSVTPTATVTWSDDNKWWTTSSGGTGYSEGTSYTPTSSATLYAHYTGTTGTYSSPTLALRAALTKADDIDDRFVTYNTTNGGAASITSTSFEITVSHPFDKWRLGSTTGTSYNAGATFTPTVSSTTFYATFSSVDGTVPSITTATATKPNTTATATLTYNLNTGTTVSPTSTSYTVTTSYTGKGWYTAASGGTKRADLGGSYTPPAAGETVYVQWNSSSSGASITLPVATKDSTTANKTVTFNGNGGTVQGSFVISSKSFIVTTSYTNTQWNIGSASGTKLGNAGAQVAGPISSTTVYAVWSSSQSSASVSTPTPTKRGYNCTGWYTAETGGTKRANAGASYTPPVTGETVYAQWTDKDNFINGFKCCYVRQNGVWRKTLPFVWTNRLRKFTATDTVYMRTKATTLDGSIVLTMNPNTQFNVHGVNADDWAYADCNGSWGYVWIGSGANVTAGITNALGWIIAEPYVYRTSASAWG